VFVGKVVFTNDDGSGTIAQQTLVHFEVEEAFKGLKTGTRDVWIDPGSFTSCYAEYHLGERLLVFAYRGGMFPPDSPAVSVVPRDAARPKPWPTGFDPMAHPPVYLAPECSGTRLITAETEKDVGFELR
jgi:hypothetical protein